MSHESMISTLVGHLQRNKFTAIKADHIQQGYEQPTKLTWKATGQGHIPDATAFLDQRGYIFEVETADSLSLQQTADQLSLFSAYSQEHGCTFVLVVPKTSETIANSLLKSLGAIAEVWTIG